MGIEHPILNRVIDIFQDEVNYFVVSGHFEGINII